MTKVEDLAKRIIDFRNARNWKQFHNPKDLALSLVLEATEVMEHFQWKNAKEMEEHLKNNKGEVADEMADTLYWLLLMSYDFDIDLLDALDKKLNKIEAKYPIEKAKGKHTKYNKL
jgi:NTP pyrophosphatase (non-canonical NTP hydrolase)